jgi:hypothetical protein
MLSRDLSQQSSAFKAVVLAAMKAELSSCEVWTHGGFIKGILRGVRCTKSLRVLFLHRRPPSWTTLVLKAVNREDKRSRRYRDRDLAKFERSRRYRDRYRCPGKKSRRGRDRDLVFETQPRRE